MLTDGCGSVCSLVAVRALHETVGFGESVVLIAQQNLQFVTMFLGLFFDVDTFVPPIFEREELRAAEQIWKDGGDLREWLKIQDNCVYIGEAPDNDNDYQNL